MSATERSADFTTLVGYRASFPNFSGKPFLDSMQSLNVEQIASRGARVDLRCCIATFLWSSNQLVTGAC
jgi:hypothetical protein